MTNTIKEAADRLYEAQRKGTPCAPVRDILGTSDLDAAYAVQRMNEERRVEAGARVTGRKIGLTSLAVQKQLGVDQPDLGSIFADCEYGDGLPVPMADLLQPKAEVEIALILGRDIDVPRPGIADILRATAYLSPAIEIVASRVRNWDITIVDTIADNASFGGYILGGPVHAPAGLDLAAMRMSMRINDNEASTGSGAACLGNPLNAAVWLARKMSDSGQPLREGEIILTGALGPMQPIAPGDNVEGEIEGLGKVRFSCT